MTLTLSETVTSNFKKIIYAKAGDKVKVIEKRGNVYLVEKGGVKFPVNESKIKP